MKFDFTFLPCFACRALLLTAALLTHGSARASQRRFLAEEKMQLWTPHSMLEVSSKRSMYQPPTSKGQSDEVRRRCEMERDRLQNQNNQLIAKKEALKKRCEDRKNQLERRLASQEKNTGELEKMVNSRNDQSEADDLAKMYSLQYKTTLCSMIYKAFFQNSPDARIELTKYCQGQQSLSAITLSRSVKAPDLLRPPQSHNMVHLVDKFTHRAKQTALAEGDASPECFQAETVQEEFDSLSRELDTLSNTCDSEEKMLSDKLDTGLRHEKYLWEQYHSAPVNKEKIKVAAEEKYKDETCTVVQQNINFNECAIKSHYNQRCV